MRKFFMRKFLMLTTAGLFCAFSAKAQPVIDLGVEAEPKVENLAPIRDLEHNAPTAASSAAAQAAISQPEGKDGDSGGLFSIFDFSFFKKKHPDVAKEAEANHETFLQTLTRKAEEGNVDAQVSLGYMYLYGDKENNVTQDYKQALNYYSMAAAQNDNVAVNNLGSLYYSGIGTKKNPYKAAELFKKASDMGNVEASVNLAFLYLSGSGVAQDGARAMNYLAKASNEGNYTAQYMLGYAYYRGFMVPQNYQKAFELMRDAAKAGYDDAQYFMGLMYLDGNGITKNYGNAVKYLGNAFMQGNINAMVRLADIFAEGTVYPQNVYQAYIMYNIASNRGVAEAAAKRDELEKVLKIENILQAQAEAEKFKDQPKELTTYIRKTFGYDIYHYIDDLMPQPPQPAVQNVPQSAPAAPAPAPTGSRPLL